MNNDVIVPIFVVIEIFGHRTHPQAGASDSDAAQRAPGAHGVDVPIRSIEQALHALRSRLAEVRGQLPAVLVFD